MVRSSVCIYCGRDLIPFGHWGLCPEHSRDFIQKLMPKKPRLATWEEKRHNDLKKWRHEHGGDQ